MPETDVSDRLIADRLKAKLGNALIGRRIVVLEETTSTNDIVFLMAQEDSSEGLVVLAEHQTAGRGQRGNRWESSAYKGLWFSVLLRPKIELAESVRLTAWAAQTVADTIASEFSLPASIKAPNDVIINDRKVAGVLVEMKAQPRAPHLAIAGLGINLNQATEDFPDELKFRATSLALCLGRLINRNKFAVALLQNLDRTYAALLKS